MSDLTLVLIFIYSICSIVGSFGFNDMANKGKSPIDLYKKWLKNKNTFGKIYVSIFIVLTFSSVLWGIIIGIIYLIGKKIYLLGIKNR